MSKMLKEAGDPEGSFNYKATKEALKDELKFQELWSEFVMMCIKSGVIAEKDLNAVHKSIKANK